MPDDTSARLSGIGIGPGDPELLTLKAARLINEADIIFTPKARIKGESLARNIVEAAGAQNRNFIEIEFPMVTDETRLEEKWISAAKTVSNRLAAAEGSLDDRGVAAVFITLGDPGIYSTWTYLQRALAKIAPQIKTETVAGISTMNAAAASLNRPLIIGNERLALIPLPENLDEFDQLVGLFDTIVVYKVSNRLHQFGKKMDRLGLSDSTSLVRRTGLPDEQLFRSLSELKTDTEGYLTTAIIYTKQKKDLHT